MSKTDYRYVIQDCMNLEYPFFVKKERKLEYGGYVSLGICKYTKEYEQCYKWIEQDLKDGDYSIVDETQYYKSVASKTLEEKVNAKREKIEQQDTKKRESKKFEK